MPCENATAARVERDADPGNATRGGGGARDGNAGSRGASKVWRKVWYVSRRVTTGHEAKAAVGRQREGGKD